MPAACARISGSLRPSHHVWLGTNHRPSIRGTDLAIWRRLREIPFTVAIPEDRVVKDMDRRLADEYSGILNWCIEGVMSWQAEGLLTPDEVITATAEYKSQQDILAQFFASACVLASPETRAADAGKPLGKIAIKANAKVLHTAFNNWLSSNTSRGPMVAARLRQADDRTRLRDRKNIQRPGLSGTSASACRTTPTRARATSTRSSSKRARLTGVKWI